MRPRDPFTSPRFGQVATFMLLPAAESPRGLDLALLGIAYDGDVAYRPGARLGPRAVREPLEGPEDLAFHDEHGIEVVRIEAVKEPGTAPVAERLGWLRGAPVYCSFDIDAVDPALAPGTGTPEVGELTSYEALALAR